MTPKQQFICKLVGLILGALVVVVPAVLTFMQSQSNRADALRSYDMARRRRRSAVHASVPVAEFGRKTDMRVLADSVQAVVDKAVDDTATVLVKPMWFQSKSQRVTVRSLRKR